MFSITGQQLLWHSKSSTICDTKFHVVFKLSKSIVCHWQLDRASACVSLGKSATLRTTRVLKIHWRFNFKANRRDLSTPRSEEEDVFKGDDTRFSRGEESSVKCRRLRKCCYKWKSYIQVFEAEEERCCYCFVFLFFWFIDAKNVL